MLTHECRRQRRDLAQWQRLDVEKAHAGGHDPHAHQRDQGVNEGERICEFEIVLCKDRLVGKHHGGCAAQHEDRRIRREVAIWRSQRQMSQ